MELAGPEAISGTPPPPGWVRLALLFYGAMTLAAWAFRRLWQGEALLFASPEAAADGIHWVADPSAGLVVAALSILLSREFTRRSRSGERLARSLAAALGPLELRHCLVLAAASGVGEEALFRGALQPSLGLLGASLVFGLAHLVPRRGLWPWSVLAFAGGLALGGLFHATGNLVAPMVAHGVLNAVNLRLLVRDYGASGASPPPR